MVAMAPDGTFFDRWDLTTSLGPFVRQSTGLQRPQALHDREFRRAEIPAASLHSNARRLDRLYAVLAVGGTAGQRGWRRPPRRGVRPRPRARRRSRHGAAHRVRARLEHTIPEWTFGPGTRTYGHNGRGGSLGIVDPDAGVSLGYAMNRLWWGKDRTDPRWGPIFDALYATLSKLIHPSDGTLTHRCGTSPCHLIGWIASPACRSRRTRKTGPGSSSSGAREWDRGEHGRSGTHPRADSCQPGGMAADPAGAGGPDGTTGTRAMVGARVRVPRARRVSVSTTSAWSSC